MNSFKYILLVATTIFIASCSEKQARKPISQNSGTFMKESIDRNKKLNEQEKIAITKIMIMKLPIYTEIPFIPPKN